MFFQTFFEYANDLAHSLFRHPESLAQDRQRKRLFGGHMLLKNRPLPIILKGFLEKFEGLANIFSKSFFVHRRFRAGSSPRQQIHHGLLTVTVTRQRNIQTNLGLI